MSDFPDAVVIKGFTDAVGNLVVPVIDMEENLTQLQAAEPKVSSVSTCRIGWVQLLGFRRGLLHGVSSRRRQGGGSTTDKEAIEIIHLEDERVPRQ